MSLLRCNGKTVFTWYTRGKRGRSHYVFVVNNCWHPWGLWISSEYYISKLHLGLNISIKLNKLLIDAFVIFSSPHRPFETSFHKMTVGWRPLRGGSVTWSTPCRGVTAWVPQWPRELHQRERMLLVGPPMLNRSKGRGQTNMDHLTQRLNGFA